MTQSRPCSTISGNENFILPTFIIKIGATINLKFDKVKGLPFMITSSKYFHILTIKMIDLYESWNFPSMTTLYCKIVIIMKRSLMNNVSIYINVRSITFILENDAREIIILKTYSKVKPLSVIESLSHMCLKTHRFSRRALTYAHFFPINYLTVDKIIIRCENRI